MDPCVRRAMLWEALEEPGVVRCGLCAHRCRVGPGKRGICGVRENRAGELDTLVYGRLVAEHLDPIEKKPLYHFLPGSASYSVATAGCNFRCKHCQNYSISQGAGEQAPLPGEYVAPETLVERAESRGAASLSFTYTEPTVFSEYAVDAMRLARGRGLANVYVTNGYMTPEAVGLLAEAGLDAANVDLKAMTEEFYRKVCGARLAPVLEAIGMLWEKGVWVEATTLIIPGYNDGDDELRAIAKFLAGVSPDLPWHVTGFFPTFRLTDAPPTPASTLARARSIGLEEGLRFVYQGNRPGAGGEDTACPACGAALLRRRGLSLAGSRLTAEGKCPDCGRALPGRF